VLVVGLIAYPFYRAVSLSFTDKLVGYPERWVGLRNYIYLAGDDTFRTVVRNSLVFTVASVALKVGTGLLMALVLHNTWRWRNFFRGLLLLPWITSTVIIALTWRWMFDAFPGAASSTACSSTSACRDRSPHGHAGGRWQPW
jgi:multiple sugar transport system permease protein/arabinogalactan oligomer/maltooligosaccharide transport system permease protein